MASHPPLDKEIEAIGPSPPLSSSGSSDLDDTYDAYKANQGNVTLPAEAKRVLRKVDRRVVPILFFIYLLQYLDKNGINYASAFGLAKGTNLQGQDYSWLGSIFYFGYLLGQYPSGYLLQRLPIAKFLGFATLGELIFTTSKREIATNGLNRMGHHSHDNASLHKLRRYGDKSVSARFARIDSQSRLCAHYVDVVYIRRTAFAP
jgi:hypothetical protein